MNTEMESMYSNQVSTLVDPAVGVKPIGCKWIYKIKIMIDIKVKTFLGTANGNGVTPIKKVFNTFQPMADDLSEFSHPLYLIGTMRYSEWMSRQLSLTEILRRPFYGSTRRFIAKGQK